MSNPTKTFLLLMITIYVGFGAFAMYEFREETEEIETPPEVEIESPEIEDTGYIDTYLIVYEYDDGTNDWVEILDSEDNVLVAIDFDEMVFALQQYLAVEESYTYTPSVEIPLNNVTTTNEVVDPYKDFGECPHNGSKEKIEGGTYIAPCWYDS